MKLKGWILQISDPENHPSNNPFIARTTTNNAATTTQVSAFFINFPQNRSGFNPKLNLIKTLGEFVNHLSDFHLVSTTNLLIRSKKLTSDEQKVVDELISAFSTSKFAEAVTMPLSNETWWVDTPKLIAEIGGTCDRYITEQNDK